MPRVCPCMHDIVAGRLDYGKQRIEGLEHQGVRIGQFVQNERTSRLNTDFSLVRTQRLLPPKQAKPKRFKSKANGPKPFGICQRGVPRLAQAVSVVEAFKRLQATSLAELVSSLNLLAAQEQKKCRSA